MIKCLAMFGAVKEKARVRRDVERRLAQAIVLQVHPDSLAKKMPQGKKTLSDLLTLTLACVSTIVTKDFRSLAVLN